MNYPVHGLGVLLYLGALILVGLKKARSVRTQEDFSLAGRGLGAGVLCGTLLATWIGTGSLFGNAEEALRVGPAAFILPLAGAAGILALYALAGRARRSGAITVQDILEERFGPAARVLGTLTLLVAYTIIVSYQYRAGAAVVSYLLPDVNQGWLLPLVALFVIAYTALAGMQSVARTDLVNGVLMTVGILLALVVVVNAVGGPAELLALPAAATPAGATPAGSSAYSAGDIISVLLPSFLLLLGDANMYQRFFSAKDAATARRSALGMFCGVLLLELAIIALALAGGALVQTGQISAPDNPGHVIVHLAFADTGGAPLLPLPLGALLAATVLAVIVSTADSYLLAPATALVRDIFQRFLRPDMAEQSLVRVSRRTVVVLGLVALGLAYLSDRFFSVALFAYTLYGAGITPALLAALFWPRARPGAAVCSMLAGVAVALGWKYGAWGGLISGAFAPGTEWGAWAEFIGELHAVVPAALASFGVLILGSLLPGRHSQAPQARSTD